MAKPTKTYTVTETTDGRVTITDSDGETVAVLQGADAWTRALTMATVLHNAYMQGARDQIVEEELKCYKWN